MPDSLSPQHILRRRTIGLLIRRAREGAGRTLAQLADALQVKPSVLKAYEAGTRELSLGELLLMGEWLSVPLTALLDESAPKAPTANPLTGPQTSLQLRNHVIGAKLKQARMDKGQPLKNAASAVGISASRLKSYELGESIPITVLEGLNAHLGLTVQHWLDADALLIGKAQQQQAAFATLPADVRAFVTDASALPFLQVAMQLRTPPKT